jgi:hypothetical protein
MSVRLAMRPAMFIRSGRVVSATSPSLAFKASSARLLCNRSAPITTLAIPRLSVSDFVSLSAKMSYFLTHSDGVQGQIIYKTHVPFPTETQGVFYYHPGPAHAPIAGEVRFRIVENGRPADFHAGKDLLRHSVPLPWSIPLVAVFQIANYAPFAHLVKASGLLGKDILRSLRGGAAKMPRVNKNSRIIHSLGQRIHIDAYEPRLMIAHGNALKGPLSTHLLDDTRGNRRTLAYTGTAHALFKGILTLNMCPLLSGSMVCSFERAPKIGAPKIHIRVHKILHGFVPTNPDYDGYVPKPVEGDLLPGPNRPWMTQMDEFDQLPDLSDGTSGA